MTQKPNVLFIPACYNNADTSWVSNFLVEARKVLGKTHSDYTETSLLSDLDSVAAIKSQGKKRDYDVVILYLITWIDPNVAIDLLVHLKDHPVILWCADYRVLDGKKQQAGAFAAFLPIKGSLEQLGLRFACLYDYFGKGTAASQLSGMIQAASAVARLKSARIGMVGHTALGIYPGMCDPLQVKKLCGTEIIPLDNHTLITLCQSIFDSADLDDQLNAFSQNFQFTDPVAAKEKRLCLAMTQAVRQLISKHRLSAITLKCCYELAIDFGFAPCVPLSRLSEECVTSCECDIPVTLTQLILSYITQKPSPYIDLLMMDEFHIYGACCGFGAFQYAAGGQRQIACSTTGQNENDLTFNRLINHSRYEDGLYTLARLNFPDGRTPYLQVILGRHDSHAEPFYEFGCKEYQSLALTVTQPTSHLIEALGSQHVAVMQGDVVNELRHVCKFMNIEIQTFY